jgi:hypothetical protein
MGNARHQAWGGRRRGRIRKARHMMPRIIFARMGTLPPAAAHRAAARSRRDAQRG